MESNRDPNSRATARVPWEQGRAMGVVWGGTFAVQRMQNKMLRLWGRLSWKGERFARLPIPAPHKIGMALHAKEVRKWR